MGINERLAEIERSVESLRGNGQDPRNLWFEAIHSPTEATLNGRSTMLFGTNNYLGLTFDPRCVQAAAGATRMEGSGTTGSRIANGSYSGHTALEAEIAEFYNKRSAVVFSTGYVANIGILSGLPTHGDYLLIDADSHASIYDGCKMSDAQTVRFRHNSPEDLAKRLRRLKDEPGDKFVVVEGIYSMLGDKAPLQEFADVKREAGDGVYLIVDEAHSLGVLGETGRGLCQEADVEDDCDFIVGTFSKSIGTVGGYCVSDMESFHALRMISRPYMFTASMTPGAIAGARAAFQIIAEQRGEQQRLWRNCEQLYRGAQALGYEVGPQPSPVVALILPDPPAAVGLWNRLIDAGLYTNIAIPPATPNSLSLLRVSVSAAHSGTQIRKALDILGKVGHELGILPDRPMPQVLSGPVKVINGGGGRAIAAKAPAEMPAKGAAVPSH
ncbi:MAG: aminotransferase class I/II-fold pyridoxal phosphate-dependent enzyme [Pseudomonadota bacterium]